MQLDVTRRLSRLHADFHEFSTALRLEIVMPQEIHEALIVRIGQAEQSYQTPVVALRGMKARAHE